jgi:hypothetical protein
MYNHAMGYRSLRADDYRSARIAVDNDAVLNVDLCIDLNGRDFAVRTSLVGPNNGQRSHEHIPGDPDMADDLG